MGAAAPQDMAAAPPWLPACAHQVSRLNFATVAEAHAARFLEWDELHSVLRSTCQAPPQWNGPICGNNQTCTSCKLQTDELTSNPLRANQDVLMGLYDAARLAINEVNKAGPSIQSKANSNVF